ncbi:MAG: hypothetical protein LUG18_01005 [Candidatus Azobacteroides sp.]|nr:hypothetical protein [Candidatus Azobacteroides sp.]
MALSIVFMVSFLVGGICEIIFTISNRDNISGWVLHWQLELQTCYSVSYW